MSGLHSRTLKQERRNADLRTGLVYAGLMLVIPLVARLAARYGQVDTAGLSQRALMVIIAAYIVHTGNAIPKRLASLACLDADPVRVQAFQRLAGWIWVLTGLTFGIAWIVRPIAEAKLATVVIVPLGIALVASWWLRLYLTRRPAE